MDYPTNIFYEASSIRRATVSRTTADDLHLYLKCHSSIGILLVKLTGLPVSGTLAEKGLKLTMLLPYAQNQIFMGKNK